MQFMLGYMTKGFDASYTEQCTYLELHMWYQKLMQAEEAKAKAMNGGNILEG